MRLKGRSLLILGAVLGILIIVATDQVVPATSAYQAQMRIWFVGRATGITAYLLLTASVALGLVLSHPVNQSTWKLSKRIFPWHENLFVFMVAFLAAHIVSLVLDPYAGVGLVGAFVPTLSSYRTEAVAIGTLALYGLIATGLTARYTKLLPPGTWLKLHRLSLLVFLASWLHGMLAGTDSDAFRAMYVATGLVVVAAAAYRYWVTRQRRPTFATSLPEDARPSPSAGAQDVLKAPTTPAMTTSAAAPDATALTAQTTALDLQARPLGRVVVVGGDGRWAVDDRPSTRDRS